MSHLTRSNAKTRLLFATGDSTCFETVHGGGVGAWSKCFDRAMAKLFPAATQVRLARANGSALSVKVTTPDDEFFCLVVTTNVTEVGR